MSPDKYVNKSEIIKHFILGIAVWMAILLVITFIQSSYSRGLFFLVATGISLAYFVIAQFVPSSYRKDGEDTRVNLYSQSANRNTSYIATMEIVLVPGWILGSWIFGILQLSNQQRKWVSITVGGLFGFAMTQVLILIAKKFLVQTPGAFIFTTVGLVVLSTFLGSISAGVIDKDEAVTRGMQAGVTALAIYLIYELIILMFFSFEPLIVNVDIYIIFWVWIPIVALGGLGGKIGSYLRLKDREPK